MTTRSARFWPGPGTGIHDRHMTLVADTPPGEELSLRLLDLVARNGGVEDIVDEIFRNGVWHAPDFAVAAIEETQVRAVVRGSGYVLCGTTRVEARGPFTDATLPPSGTIEVGLDRIPPGAGLPSTGGIVPAQAWRLAEAGVPQSPVEEVAGAMAPAARTEEVAAAPTDADRDQGHELDVYRRLLAPGAATGARADLPAPPQTTATGFIDAVPFAVGDPAPGDAAAVIATAEMPSPTFTTAPDPWRHWPEEVPAPPPAGTPDRVEVGHTVHRATLHRPPGGPQTVAALRCPRNHLTPVGAPRCRVCQERVPPQEPVQVPRPALGRLLLPTGEAFPLDRAVVLGRAPRRPVDYVGETPNLIRIVDPRSEVSSQHAMVTLDSWSVVLTDLGSTNGTEIVRPDGGREQLAANTPHPMIPGSLIVLAETVEIRFEAVP